MKPIILGGLVAMLVGLAPGAGAEPVRRAFHDEVGRVWGEMADQIRSLGAHLERHMRGLPGAHPVAERPLISFMLDHRADLGLTPEQATRLEALRADFARELIRREADIRIAEMDLAALLEAEPLDLGQVEAKIREAAQLRADLRIARLRTIEQGKAVLTAEQRARLQTLLGAGRGPRRTAERPTRL
ncbi:MAG: Spy/CpxP family protein refolding chaperone [Candidatus Rokuibacteriota bacterium]